MASAQTAEPLHCNIYYLSMIKLLNLSMPFNDSSPSDNFNIIFPSINNCSVQTKLIKELVLYNSDNGTENRNYSSKLKNRHIY